MKCSDVDRILPEIVDGVAIEGSQELEVKSHLETCPDCSELVSDLKLIVRESRQLVASEEPSPRVWARIAADLRAEGLIREHGVEVARPVLIPAGRRRWNPFWLAPVAAAVLAACAYLLNHKPTQPSASLASQPDVVQQAQTQAAPPPSEQPAGQQAGIQKPAARATTHSAPQLAQRKSLPPPQDSSSQGQAPAQDSTKVATLSQPASDDDSQFLTEVSQRAPTMRATYANQLRAVNNEIRETKAYISRYPGDIDARQHLLEVYEQKAMLYQMALDRIQ